MLNIVKDPVYDKDYVNLRYLKKIIKSINDNAEELKNNIEKGLIKNYGNKPNPPYNVGDTWTTENYIYRCIKSRDIGSFNMSDWVVIYDKEKEELYSQNFLFLSDIEIVEQQDGKIETYYLVDDPSVNWITTLDKSLHEGDFWRKKAETGNEDYIYTKLATNPVSYEWIKSSLPITVYNTITSYKTIYLEKPTSYNEHDLWRISKEEYSTLFENININDFLISNNTNTNFNISDWVKAENELSLKSIESYYVRVTELSKELKKIEDYIEKKIIETEDSITASIKGTYATIETTNLLEEKIDANGESIDAIIGTTEEEITIQSLAALTLSLAEITSLVSEQITIVNETVTSVKELSTQLTQDKESFLFNISELNQIIEKNNEAVSNEIKDINNTLETGVSGVKNSLVEININGVKVALNLSKVSTLISNNSFTIQDNTGKYLAFIGYDEKEGKSKAEMDNLTIKNHLTSAKHRNATFIYPEDGEEESGWFYT